MLSTTVHLTLLCIALILNDVAGESSSLSFTTIGVPPAGAATTATSVRDTPIWTSFDSGSGTSSPILITKTSTDATSTLEISTIVFSPVYETSAASLDVPTEQPTPNAASITSSTVAVGQPSQFGLNSFGSNPPNGFTSSAMSSSGPAPTAFVVSSQTLAMSQPVVLGQGSAAVTVSLVAAGNGGTDLVIGSTTLPISQLTAGISVASSRASATVQHGSAAITAGGLSVSTYDGAIMAGSTPLTIGRTVTRGSGPSMTLISLQTATGDSGLQILVADSSSTTTENLPTASSNPSQSGSHGSAARPTSEAVKLHFGIGIVLTVAVGWLWSITL